MKYILSPYSHPLPEIRNQRFKAASDATASLILAGYCVFSPIVYSHQFAELIGTDIESWKDFDFRMLALASEAWVLTLPGWNLSIGVREEIEFAKYTLKIPVKYLDPVTLKVEETPPSL